MRESKDVLNGSGQIRQQLFDIHKRFNIIKYFVALIRKKNSHFNNKYSISVFLHGTYYLKHS